VSWDPRVHYSHDKPQILESAYRSSTKDTIILTMRVELIILQMSQLLINQVILC